MCLFRHPRAPTSFSSSPGCDPGIQNGNNADLFNLDPRIKSGDDRKKKNKVPRTTKEKKQSIKSRDNEQKQKMTKNKITE